MQVLYKSTRGKGETVTASMAILKGLSEDGGLFVPTEIPKMDVPAEKLAQMTYQETAYEVMSRFLTDFTEDELKNCIANAYDEKFDTKELASKDGQHSPFGEQQVRSELLFLLNRIRTAWGRQIIVNSAYRSPEHNRAVGGVENSYHVQGLAADIRPENLEDLPELQDLCLELNSDGGVGLYDSFVHVDARGFKARWDNCKK